MWEPFSLQNGPQLPAIQLGPLRTNDAKIIKDMVNSALGAGYRSFDTAAEYGNELHVGEALKKLLPKYHLTLDNIFVTSKLSNADHGSKQRVLNAFANTEMNLGFSPNLYLINFPGSKDSDPKDQRLIRQRNNAWSGMTELYDSGHVNSIGVCDFTKDQLQELLKEYHSDIPVVNQVEWHPFCYDNALLEYCNKNCIQLQGYNSLGGKIHCGKLLKNAKVKQVAKRHNATAAQVLLTWSLQRGVAVAPKSKKEAHITENVKLDFKLTLQEVHAIDQLLKRRGW